MKKFLIVFMSLILISNGLTAQDDAADKYMRSSLYSVLLVDNTTKMSTEIINSFLALPVPDKFNDHNLSLRYVITSKKEQKNRKLEDQVSEFITKNQIPKRMVSKWFNRDKQDGSFNLNTIMERGNYNASMADINQALTTVRGLSMLSDAGEQLIGHSFVIVNNITYVDKEQNAQIASAIFSALASAFGGIAGATASLAQSISETIAGFNVKVNTYLYRLEWNDEMASTFYSQYYYDKSNVDLSKKEAYENERNLFKLKYVGSVTTNSDKTVMRGMHNPDDVFRKVLARAIDKNIVALQKNFDEFKVVVPIYKVQDNNVMVQVGLKEGVSVNSRYEVMETVEDANGKITYVRKGIIKPVERKIWDNRYMAVEEAAANANLSYTTFEVVSGSGFYPGMLVREIKYNSGM